MLVALDSNFDEIEHINNAILLIWERKYYECGQFILTIPTKDYSETIKYIYNQKHKETAIVQSVNIIGNIATLRGFFIEKILDDRIIYPTFNYSGNIEQCARAMVSKYKEDLPVSLGIVSGIGTNIQMQETGTELGRRIYELYKTQGMSYKLVLDYKLKTINFVTYKGLNRTSEQSANTTMTFSQFHKNISQPNALFDESNFKNYTIVAGAGEGAKRRYVYVDISSPGEYKRKIFFDARDIQPEEGQSQADYDAELKQRGLERLEDFKKIENFDIGLMDTQAYLNDFDIGDDVDVILENFQKAFIAKVVEVIETTQNNSTKIELVLGDKKPTIYKKARMGGV